MPDEREIFDTARSMGDAAARAAYLAEACGDDPSIRQRVESLLRVHDEENSFLASPAITADLDPPLMFTAPGTVIGRYKILEPIGEGGYGSVFMAEQTTPVQRRVALKIIKAGMDTRQVIARFEAERQALALMDHPNIAKVHDAGVTDTGRPYFVMELVKGVPITRYCDEHRLKPEQRLELFIQVCHAVQHAHQKGIIHRDIKPTNVLVAQYDGKPVPKVIDFGVSKATGQRLTERTMFTSFGDVIGTPQYMSPEQAELNQLDVDTRSDIYSLGVLLYELLTGTTPLESKRLKELALLEVLRVIREEEPPRPSTRLTTTAELPSIAAQRGLEPKSLSGIVKGELDWIVMKALEKDRNRRYETANGLARDIERYMSDEPVTACPPSAAYRFRKFARRNSAAVITASAVLVSLLLFLGGLIVSNRLIAASRNETAEALRQKGLALSAAQASAEHANAQRRIAEENLRKARYEGAVRELGQQSLTGNFEEGASRVRACIAVFHALKRECPTEPAYGQQLAWSHVVLARILGNAGQPHDAQAAAQQALELYEPLLAVAPVVADQVHGAMVAYRIKGRVLRENGRLDEAERVLQRAVALHEQHPAAATPADVSMREHVARVYFDLGDLRVATAQMRDAADLYARGLKIYPDYHWQWYQLAALYLCVGDVARYRSVCLEMLDRFEKRAETVPQIAEITAKTCSLVPQSVPDVSRVERLVDLMMSETEHTYYRHFILAKGLVDYRAGRHRQAVEALQRYAPSAGGTHWDATAFAALAMAQHRNGDAPQARASLDAARAIIDRKPPDAMRGDYWFDWLHCEILLREAEQLLAERKEASN